MKHKKILKCGFLLGLCLVSVACDPVAKINEIIAALRHEEKNLPAEVKNEMSTAQDPAQKASASELARANLELLSEMMKVVFDQDEVEDRSGFGGLAHGLNEGASLEGIYQGMIMGSRYRALESKSQAASPADLKLFAEEMAELQLSMKNPSVFVPEEAKKAPSIDFPDGSNPNIPVSKAGTQVVEKKREKAELMEDLLQTFIGASKFTLKRILGQEALKKIDEMKGDSGDLARWYAQFVLRMCEKKVDFGLDLRVKPDFDLHFKFAQRMALDRVKWEVLNRYHRYLNWSGHRK
jgi:hypothetical protein